MSETAEPFTNVRPRRAVDEIIEQIRERILSGALKPGEKLPSERDLAVQLGVSRNTLREAIRMLEFSGLVTLKKGASGGAFLNDSNASAVSQTLLDGIALRQFEAGELVDVRGVLEDYIVEQACAHATEAELDELDELARLSERAETDVTDYEIRLNMHLNFHQKLAQCSHNTVAETLTRPLLDITRRIHLEAGPRLGQETHATRRELMTALRARDVGAAKTALATHISSLRRRLLDSPGATDATS